MAFSLSAGRCDRPVREVAMSTSVSDRVPSIEPAEAFEALSGDALLLDVRDAHEWAAGRAMHAVHIPLGELSTATQYTSRVRQVIVVSRTGRRAEKAVARLRAAGVNAVVLHGGLRAWAAAGGELAADPGHEPHIASHRDAEA
jgi:rhodanese-related sulfurtransferase